MLTKEQLALEMEYGRRADSSALRDAAASDNKSLPIHRWVPWIAGFSAGFVEDAISEYLPKSRRSSHLILDPFAGVGTTLVEGLKAGHDVVGYEINPFACMVSRAKMQCTDVSGPDLRSEIDAFRSGMYRFEAEVDERWLSDPNAEVLSSRPELATERPSEFRSRIPFFSPPVEAKFLYALQRTTAMLEPERSLFRAALGATMVSYSNYSYEPSLASRPGAGKSLIENASVAASVCSKMDEIATDIEWARQNYAFSWPRLRRDVYEESYFNSKLNRSSVSLVVTSPPYMNNYHYVRNTRPQLHWLGFWGSDSGKVLEHTSFGKFWQTVRQSEAVDLCFRHGAVERLMARLREKNPEKGYYGGSGWANYVATYLNDCERLVRILKRQLRTNGAAVVVVGNSIIQGIEFKVDQILAEMATERGLAANVQIVRTKRVGSSIIDSSVRNGDSNGHRGKTQLYDAAVIIRKKSA